MLLLDGCFVVEFIREHCEMVPKGEARIIINNRASYIFRDLMLLENQLPFFVVNKLHSMTKQVNESSLVILHLLYFIYYTYFHVMRLIPGKKSKCIALVRLCQMQQSFPKLELGDTETLLRNVIAYEKQSSDVQLSKYFSHYAVFMDNLIDSEKDVNLLRQEGIIVNLMGDDKDVASLFNKIGNAVTLYPDFYYNEEFKQAIEYSEKPWNTMKANLKHNYFSSPWVGASIVAAIILLILTTIQTILAFTGSVK
ncbi:putative UPF0481 protein At3g02645 [Solanum verrucosum]|uniref:putative UPF0481 protein At3g02645 n=1 Tax=Solanum verrucosum TaxID=315347 RepID=UPI0020D138B2|nr:putative UPF0481 protein At3g02645 [Solanum verrucosum]